MGIPSTYWEFLDLYYFYSRYSQALNIFMVGIPSKDTHFALNFPGTILVLYGNSPASVSIVGIPSKDISLAWEVPYL
jgi:hypothetical protein